MDANSPMTPTSVPPEARAGRPDMRVLPVGPPPGVSDDDCGTVEALVGSIGGLTAYADYWRPTAEQLATLNAGGFLELVQYSPRMVMHSLSVWESEPTTLSATTEPSSDWGRGAWMQTFTGRQFYPLAPQVDDIDPVDIAHALSLICRYGGHTTRFYSVAEHCVLMSHAVAPEHALWALLHDATEAYVGDMVRPLKYHMPAYQEAEERVLRAIEVRFGLRHPDEIPTGIPAAVKEADNRILLDERAALLGPAPERWAAEHLQPLGVRIRGHVPAMAKIMYADRLRELTGGAR
jgi:hypothetical protein